MRFNYYDIESLRNVFTLVNYDPTANSVDIYFLLDDMRILDYDSFADMATRRVHEKNHNFTGSVCLLDLHDQMNMGRLARTMGVSSAGAAVNDPDFISEFDPEFRPVCDTDPDYDPDKHPYLLGYNSYNYDLTMLAFVFSNCYTTEKYVSGYDEKTKKPIMADREFTIGYDRNGREIKKVLRPVFKPDTAASIRDFNDKLFDNKYRSYMPRALFSLNDNKLSWNIRKAMLMSGRHIDVARLNEKQSRVGLKRLLGMLGYQILESDKLGCGFDRINSQDELCELLAYNVSDCVNLEKLFEHPFYQGQFSLKRELLNTYPELVYAQKPGAYEPNIDAKCVRADRMTPDSPSAQMATMALCPYGNLKDIEYVDYSYPAKETVEALRAQGIPAEQRDILEETWAFVQDKFHDHPGVIEQFKNVYDYYNDIRGKNFNDSDYYADDIIQKLNDNNEPGDEDWLELDNDHTPRTFGDIEHRPNCLPYFDADGKPTSCYVTFSTGGIHGAEYNKALYEADIAAWEQTVADLDYVKSVYPDPLDLRRDKEITMPDGRVEKYTKFLKSGATIKAMGAMPDGDTRAAKFYRDAAQSKPQLFKTKDNGSTELNKKYTYTSADLANHEDFTSYYPNLLRQMRAFWNDGLGKDRYGEIFDNKQRYGKLMKDKSLSQEERDLYAVKREGTKLILNSASGAADTLGRNSAIQMNNRIISMRIIGQLFTWRIGQAQTLEGAKITSTNTDGLYSVMEKTLNDAILERESADIGVAIEPEPMYLISKDANNRMELSEDLGTVYSTGGASLSCFKDTNPTKALAHPAIIDWALSRYLTHVAKNGDLHDEFDESLARSIFDDAPNVFSPQHLLRMYQNVLASSPGSINYIFAMTDEQMAIDVTDDDYVTAYTPLQHYNRVFIMREGTPGCVHLMAANAKVVTAVMQDKRSKTHDAKFKHEKKAKHVLESQGVTMNSITTAGKEAVIKKIPNLDPAWSMLVDNTDINAKPDAEARALIAALDIDKYIGLLRDSYESNWKNA